MKKMVMMLGVLLLSTSCLTLDGSLQVREAFTVKKKSGFLNLKTKEVRIDPAGYRASLKVKSDKNYSLQLEGGSIGKIDVPLKAKSDLNIPFDGAFNISHEQIDQPFDVAGIINTDIDESGYTNAVEACSWNITERKCDKVCDKDNKCDVVCRDVSVTLKGHKDVAYHYRTTRRDLSLDFTRAGSTSLVASFAGSDVATEKIVDRESQCRSYR